jgi:hypothetical protein
MFRLVDLLTTYQSTLIIALSLGILLIPATYAATVIFSLVVISYIFITLKSSYDTENKLDRMVDQLKEKVEKLDAEYLKNNENVVINKPKRFKYIFLDRDLVSLLLELFQYEPRHIDTVLSVVVYSELFMKEVNNVLKQKCPKRTTTTEIQNHLSLVKIYGEQILDHIMSLGMKYDSHLRIEMEKFIWSTYDMVMKETCYDLNGERFVSGMNLEQMSNPFSFYTL